MTCLARILQSFEILEPVEGLNFEPKTTLQGFSTNFKGGIALRFKKFIAKTNMEGKEDI